jgi:two-component system, NtrC family, nitrogen regulation response regulator GlnG
MIFLFTHDQQLANDLIELLPGHQGEQYFEEARLLGSISIKKPEGILFDLRTEPKPIKTLERIYYEYPALQIVALINNESDREFLYDRSVIWPADPAYIVRNFEEIAEDRRVIQKCGLVGRSVQLASAARVVLQVAASDINVLITGPSGAGKEMIARALHNNSSNPLSPFIAVNVAALAPGIVESELFGHEKGAFTGAGARRIGVFEQASEGMIFLDEIGEIPLEIQAKLLRVLEQHTFNRVGGNIPINANFRLITATNRDLAGDVEIGRFRQDLYYRLRVVSIDLPALAQRKADIVPLANHFLSLRSKELKTTNLSIDPGALRLFHRYDWPGNIRELKNVIDSFSITSPSSKITAQDFEKYMIDNPSRSNLLPVVTNRSSETAEHQLMFQAIMALTNEVVSLKQLIERELNRARVPDSEIHQTSPAYNSVNVDDVERDLVTRALGESDGNRKKAAKLLGIGERTLYRKIDKYGLK